MAVGSKGLLTQSFTAASDMSAASHQYCLVQLAAGTNETAVHPCDNVQDKPFGVLRNRPARGEIAEVAIFGITKVRVGGTDLALDAQITCDASGRARAITSTSKDFVAGRVIILDASANAGGLVTATINCLNIARNGD